MTTVAHDAPVFISGDTLDSSVGAFRVTEDAPETRETVDVQFRGSESMLSQRPLRRAERPFRPMTNEELKRIAKKNPPPAEWFEGEEERPF